MKLYHWTSLENSKLIDNEGLKRGTWCIYLCKEPKDWHGEVCYEVNVARYRGYRLTMPFNCWEILCWDNVPVKDIKREGIRNCELSTIG